MLPLPTAAQWLQAIAGGHTQIRKLLRRIDHQQLFAGAPLNLRRQTAHGKAREDRSRTLVAKAPNHD